ncbi:MAG: hypothetical protein GY765_20370 [bacterium]|nr:hypothetical protein [bacterium]
MINAKKIEGKNLELVKAGKGLINDEINQNTYEANCGSSACSCGSRIGMDARLMSLYKAWLAS